MEGPDSATWFAGDLADPWVAAIAEALPRDVLRIDCPDDLPEIWPTVGPTPSALVLHRSTLSATDAQRLARLKARADRTPRIVLCVGPHARYVDVERWSRLVDVVLPEATASESVARLALATERTPPRPTGARTRIAVVSTDYEMRTTLAEVVRAGGFVAEAVPDLADASPGVMVAWDVPVLEPVWPSRLAARSRTSPVVALLGFADRGTVALARDHGAGACLDLPCEVADLIAVLDRMAILRPERGHALPPPPHSRRRIGVSDS